MDSLEWMGTDDDMDEVVIHSDGEALEDRQVEPEEEEAEAPTEKKKRGRAKRSPQGKHFVFTLNNYTALPDPSQWKGCNYCVFQEEIGEKGTAHIQGYAQFTRQLMASTFTNMLIAERICPHPWTHVANGSDKEASAYCMKEEGALDDYVEWGERRVIAGTKGARNDILTVKKRLDEGHNLLAIAKDDANFGSVIRNQRGLHWYYNGIQTDRDGDLSKMHVTWIWGPRGTGKTFRAREIARARGFTDDQIYFVDQPKQNGTRWNGYDYQPCCIIDDYSDHFWTWTFQNRLFQPNPMTVPTDGGSVKLTCYCFIVTSLEHPSDYYGKYLAKEKKDWTELERRIHQVIHLTEVHPQAFVGGRHPKPPPLGPSSLATTLYVRPGSTNLNPPKDKEELDGTIPHSETTLFHPCWPAVPCDPPCPDHVEHLRRRCSAMQDLASRTKL